MKVVKPIKTTLSIIDTLTIISALDYLIADIERHELDRVHAEKLRQRILEEVEQGAVEMKAEPQPSEVRPITQETMEITVNGESHTIPVKRRAGVLDVETGQVTMTKL